MDTIEQLQQQIAKLEDNVMRQQKLASLGTLTAGIMHEIRNPLNFVINFNKVSASLIKDMQDILDDYLEDMGEDDRADVEDILADLNSNVKSIQEQGDRVLSIIQNVLLSSRGGDSERMPSDICHLVKEYVWLAYHAMRANYNGFNVTIREEYAEGMPLVNVIPQDINRAVLNVVNNAFYAIWQQSQKGVEGYVPTLCVTVSQEGGSVRIVVSDNGGGMSEEVKRNLYTNFFTTKPAGHGTGLGMSITRDIIEAKHHGTITFESEEGRGTTFVLTIPMQ